MAEDAFAFWKEKDKSLQQESRSISPRPNNVTTTLTFRSTTRTETLLSGIDPSELYLPLRTPTRAERPHSVVARIRHDYQTRMEEEEDNPQRTGVQSAPPTLDQSQRQPLRRQRPRHQSVVGNSSTSFVSYLDGPIRSASQSNVSLFIYLLIMLRSNVVYTLMLI